MVDGGDDATLVIALPEAHAGAEVLERLQAVVAQAGLERDGAADVYATVVRDPAALGPRVRAVLSRRPVAPGPLAALPRVDDRTAAELRRLLATASSAR